MNNKIRIKRIIENIIEKDIGNDIEKLNLYNDLLLSSLEELLLITDIEKEFDIEINQKEIYNISTIGKLIELVNRLSQKA